MHQGSCIFAVRGCTNSIAANYRLAANVDDGSCRVAGCTDSLATNFWSLATFSDGSCAYPVAGCTRSIALNFRSDAGIDDGSCIILGCVESEAPNFDPLATVDDGTCGPRIEGCGRPSAANYNPQATVFLDELCRFAGCTDSTAKNFNPSSNFDDGSCTPWSRGCTHSSAANYRATAEVDDGSCFYTGCTQSAATNYAPGADFDDGSCIIQRASGLVASLGYLQGCVVFMDDDGDLSPGRSELSATSDATGYYNVPYPRASPVRVLASGGGAACVDTVTGAPLNDALETTVQATMASSLTTVATHMMRLVGSSAANASATVCANLVPCVPCSASSSQPCLSTTECLDACVLGSSPASVFSFDALGQFISGGQPDPAWAAWLAAQLNTAFSVSCTRSAFFCASAEICGSLCVQQCEDQGLTVGNYTTEQIADALYDSLARMALRGRVALEDSSPDALVELINRTALVLNQSHRNAQALAETCAQTNVLTYSVIVASTERRRLDRAPDHDSHLKAHHLEAHGQEVALSSAHAAALTGLCLAGHSGGSGHGDVGSERGCLVSFGCRREGALNFDSLATVHSGGAASRTAAWTRGPSATTCERRTTSPRHASARSAGAHSGWPPTLTRSQTPTMEAAGSTSRVAWTRLRSTTRQAPPQTMGTACRRRQVAGMYSPSTSRRLPPSLHRAYTHSRSWPKDDTPTQFIDASSPPPLTLRTSPPGAAPTAAP